MCSVTLARHGRHLPAMAASGPWRVECGALRADIGTACGICSVWWGVARLDIEVHNLSRCERQPCRRPQPIVCTNLCHRRDARRCAPCCLRGAITRTFVGVFMAARATVLNRRGPPCSRDARKPATEEGLLSALAATGLQVEPAVACIAAPSSTRVGANVSDTRPDCPRQTKGVCTHR